MNKPERDKKLDAQFVKLLEDAKRHGVGEKEFIDKILKRYREKPELPEKRGLTIDEIISTYPASVRMLIIQLVAQIERLQLPEITEEWAGRMAKKIWDLIKQAQDEDLSDPVTDLHYLGLSLDIVDSILEDVGLKISRGKKRRGGCPPDFIPGKED